MVCCRGEAAAAEAAEAAAAEAAAAAEIAVTEATAGDDAPPTLTRVVVPGGAAPGTLVEFVEPGEDGRRVRAAVFAASASIVPNFWMAYAI